MSADDIRAQIRRWDAAWQGDASAVNDVCAPEVLYHMPPFPDLRGIEAQQQFTAAFHLAFPDFQVTYAEEFIHGSTSYHRWTCSATFSGSSPLLPVPPNGKLLTAQGCHVVHWEAGKVVEAWHFGDWLGWLQQAGVLPPLGAPASNPAE